MRESTQNFIFIARGKGNMASAEIEHRCLDNLGMHIPSGEG